MSQMIYAAAVIEMAAATAVAILYRRAPLISLSLVLWLVAVLSLYRVGLSLALPGDGGCGCLGSLGGLLGKYEDQVAALLLHSFLLVGLALCLLHLYTNVADRRH